MGARLRLRVRRWLADVGGVSGGRPAACAVLTSADTSGAEASRSAHRRLAAAGSTYVRCGGRGHGHILVPEQVEREGGSR